MDEHRLHQVGLELFNDEGGGGGGFFRRRILLSLGERLLRPYYRRRCGRRPVGYRLIKRCVESAASFARTCVVDLEERREKFEGTSDRYAVVLKIRAEAATYDPDAGGDGKGGEAEADDAGSLFSLASNVSGASLRGDRSVGSASSISSVISAGSISTFSITGDDSHHKHRSKFRRRRRLSPRGASSRSGPGARRN